MSALCMTKLNSWAVYCADLSACISRGSPKRFDRAYAVSPIRSESPHKAQYNNDKIFLSRIQRSVPAYIQSTTCQKQNGRKECNKNNRRERRETYILREGVGQVRRAGKSGAPWTKGINRGRFKSAKGTVAAIRVATQDPQTHFASV